MNDTHHPVCGSHSERPPADLVDDRTVMRTLRPVLIPLAVVMGERSKRSDASGTSEGFGSLKPAMSEGDPRGEAAKHDDVGKVERGCQSFPCLATLC